MIPLFAFGESPALSTATIIEVYDKEGDLEGIVLIERDKEPLGKALPRGHTVEITHLAKAYNHPKGEGKPEILMVKP